MNVLEDWKRCKDEYNIKSILKDKSFWLLLILNLITLTLAIKQRWSVFLIAIIYVIQSIIIVLFKVIKIFTIKSITFRKNEKIKDKNLVILAKVFMSVFLIYFFINFNVFYIGFVISLQKFSKTSFTLSDMMYILIGALIFFIGHLYSFFI